MKFFNPIIFTAIALSVFVFPVGCVHKKTHPQPVRRAVAKPVVDTQKELDLKLLKAAHAKDLASVKDCVKKGGNVNVKDPSGWSAAMWSVWHWFDDKPLCAYIMHSGGNFTQHEKNNLLERAARAGDLARAEFFLELGANANYENAFGENCATLALRYFRGQYGIAENENSLPRYGNLGDVNEAIKLNLADEALARKRLEDIQKTVDAYKMRAETFAKSPQGSARATEEFEAEELAVALEFYKKESEREESNIPAGLNAAAIYEKLLDEAKLALGDSERNLRYVKFIALLKSNGANLRKLLAGKQDNSGKQDDWEGQQDKWTMDAVARQGIREKFPLVVDGLWDGELALIQLIGRGEEIFNGQMLRSELPYPKEYFFELCLNNAEIAEAWKQGQKAVSNLILSNIKQARTTHWNSANMRAGVGFGSGEIGNYDVAVWALGLGASLRGGSFTSYTEATQAEKESAFAAGMEEGEKIGRYLGAMEITMNGEGLLAAINAEVEARNAIARERNMQLFALYEEFPLEGELAEKWNAFWTRRVTRQAEWKKTVSERVRGVLSEEAERLEKSLKKASVANAKSFQSYDEAESEAEERFEEESEKLNKIREFLASDFFGETPLEELLANPPHPRDADPEWYARNCLGKIKNTQIFVNAAKAILDYGADVNARANGTEHPALVCAYLWDKPEFEKLLLSYGADKKLALFHICERNDFDLLKKILPRIKSLADVPADASGNTILHRAVLAGRADMIPEIIKRGISVDAKNKHDDTPLHLAAEREDEACVVALLKHGGNVNAKDKDGRKPFQRFWNVPNPGLSKRFAEAQKSENR